MGGGRCKGTSHVTFLAGLVSFLYIWPASSIEEGIKDLIVDTIPKIIAWILFANGCLALLGSATARIIRGKGSEPAVFIVWGIGLVSLILSVVAVFLLNLMI